LNRVYRRLGSNYPVAVIASGLVPIYVVFVASLGILILYADSTPAENLRLALFVVVLQSFYSVYLARVLRRHLAPVGRWIDSGQDALAAWRAAADFPRDYLRLLGRYLLPLWGAIAFAAYATWELDLDIGGAALVLVAALLSVLYPVGLFFLTVERAMRPVLIDIADNIEPGDEPEIPGVPLRWRLLAVLPAVNLVAGVVVAALTAPAGADFGDFALAIVISAAVALTIAMGLSVLLSDSIVTPVNQLTAAADRVAQGDLDVRVPLISTDETGILTAAFNRMSAGLRERERLREAFGTFVDPELGERILKEGTDLAGEDVEVSILFLDVRGFTSLAEQTSARDLVAMLNDLYEQVVPVVARHGGHANKFIGDGMLAVFGAPERLEDHADRAVAAALEIAACVRERYDGHLRVGIGVNSGRVLVGTIGGGGRLDFTVIGDPVNTAARVEAATRETDDDVLVTEATLELLTNNRGSWERRATSPLKGKSRTVDLYAPGEDVAK
jgi:adenylate cyclase